MSLLSLKSAMVNKQLYHDMKQPVKPRCEGWIPNSLGEVALELLECKKRHYWIWSRKPNTGKTIFLNELEKAYDCSRYSYEEKYQ